MANPGAIRRPFVDVYQIYRQSTPILPRVDLPVVVIGLCRQVVYEESAGSHALGSTTVLNIPGITTYSASIVDVAAIGGEYVAQNSDGSRDSVSSPALPQLFFVDPTYGRYTLQSTDFTVNASAGTVTIASGLNPVYDILTGTRGAYSAEGVSPAVGAQRVFTDTNVPSTYGDFVTAGVAAGDQIVLADGNTFDVVSVVNDFTLIVTDGAGSTLTPTSTGTNQSYTVRKTMTSGSGTILMSYAANRSDYANQLLELTNQNEVFDVLGPSIPLNPLAMAVDLVMRNSQTRVFALMLSSDDLTGHLAALDVLTNSRDVYGLVPLTEDQTILAEYLTHVLAMSDPIKARERVLWRTAYMVVQATRDAAESFHSVAVTGVDNETVTFSVTPGNSNIQNFGVVVGDVLTDNETGGTGRILAVTPAGAAVDDDCVLTIAVPNTIPDNAVAATGAFTCQDGDKFNDGDYLELIDGEGTTKRFEFDKTGLNTPGAGNIEIDISTAATSAAANDGDFTCDVKANFANNEWVRIEDVLGNQSTYEVKKDGTFVQSVSGSIVVDISGVGVVSGADVADEFRTAITNDTTINITPSGATAVVAMAQDGESTDGNTTVTLGGTPTGLLGKTDFSNGADGTAAEIVPIVNAAIIATGIKITTDITGTPINALTQQILGAAGNTASPTYTPFASGTGITAITTFSGGTGSNWVDWIIQSQALTTDQQAIAIAQHTDDMDCMRVRNLWPDDMDMVFGDTSAGITAQSGAGFWGGDDVIWLNAGGYWGCLMEAAKRARIRPGLPLTGQPGAGIFRLRGVEDRFTRDQLDRIVSTGTYLLEQPTGEGGAVSAVIATTSDDSDLSVAYEMGISQVDLYTKLLRRTVRPLFGRHALDSNFLAVLGAKAEAVGNLMTRPEAQNAESVSIRSLTRDPNNRDQIIMDVNFVQLSAANGGVVRIYVTA